MEKDSLSQATIFFLTYLVGVVFRFGDAVSIPSASLYTTSDNQHTIFFYLSHEVIDDAINENSKLISLWKGLSWVWFKTCISSFESSISSLESSISSSTCFDVAREIGLQLEVCIFLHFAWELAAPTMLFSPTHFRSFPCTRHSHAWPP